MKEKTKFPRQYGSMGSANRAITNYEKKNGKQLFTINQLDEGCFEVEINTPKLKK